MGPKEIVIPKEIRDKAQKALRKYQMEREREEEKRYKPKTTREVVGKCTCDGEVIRVTRTSYEYFGDPMQMIIGPGHRNQLTQVVKKETYCRSCKLLYSNRGKIEPQRKSRRSGGR